MENFMPVDEAQAAALTDRLSRSIFKGPESFIEFYNAGIINRKHADVMALAKEIAETYRNVEERSGKLVFITQQEIYLEELRKGLAPWSVIVRVKRDLAPLLADETLAQDDVVAFSQDQRGFMLRQNEEGEYEKVSGEKLYTSHDEIKAVYNSYSSFTDESNGLLLFKVSDFTRLDDSFINEMRALLP